MDFIDYRKHPCGQWFVVHRLLQGHGRGQVGEGRGDAVDVWVAVPATATVGQAISDTHIARQDDVESNTHPNNLAL